MRRVNLFIIILIASLISLIALIVVGMAVFSSAQQNPSSWMSGMWGGNMGGMMGGTGGTVVQNPALPFFGVAFGGWRGGDGVLRCASRNKNWRCTCDL